jgi:hypothetical protein
MHLMHLGLFGVYMASYRSILCASNSLAEMWYVKTYGVCVCVFTRSPIFSKFSFHESVFFLMLQMKVC